jgi:glycosyltransferase involved in cell wall biosynthesis
VRYALPSLVGALRRSRADVVIPTMGYLNLAVLAIRPALPQNMRVFPREANLPSRSMAALAAPGLARAAYRRFYPRADGVICNSQAVADELRDLCRIPLARIHRIDNPIDVDAIRRAAAMPSRVPGAGQRFVASGRLTRQKGFDRLIDLFTEADPDSHLTILGDGPDRAMLIAQTARLGLSDRVHFAGFKPSPWPAYAGADAFLLPSRWEGMPNAALEALACGTPVIAVPEAGGIGELASDSEPGFLRIAEWGPAFLSAMRAVRPDPSLTPRPPGLPCRYWLEEATAKLAFLLNA